MEEREQSWATIVNDRRCESVLEVGVWKGAFSSFVLRNCPTVKRYYMLDPWRNLEDWNKPLNKPPAEMERAYRDAMAATEFAADRRIVLRGTTLEMIDQIPDGHLDLVYIDGDHTLRGIAIDLMRTYPKVSPTGALGGDDLQSNSWAHGSSFEPTLVFPFAVYFAEAMKHPITAFAGGQYLIEKGKSGFSFTGSESYPPTTIAALARPPGPKTIFSIMSQAISRRPSH